MDISNYNCSPTSPKLFCSDEVNILIFIGESKCSEYGFNPFIFDYFQNNFSEKFLFVDPGYSNIFIF